MMSSGQPQRLPITFRTTMWPRSADAEEGSVAQMIEVGCTTSA
jgi:hypothetical protein